MLPANILWGEKERVAFDDCILVCQELIEHPTNKRRGVLVRNSTLTYLLYDGRVFISVPQDWADEKAEMFKDEIRTSRLNAGLTQKEAAEILGVPLSTYVNWEGQKRRPPYYVKKMVVEKLTAIWKQKQDEFESEPWKSLKGFLETMAQDWNDNTEQKVCKLLELADAPVMERNTHSPKDIQDYIERNWS